jgi:glycine oxidase
MTGQASGHDFVVVGGGAVGCAVAYELRKRGASVLLIERDGVAAHASGFAYGGLFATTGAGIPGPVLPVAKDCVALHRELAAEIEELTGLDTGLRPTGTIEVAFDEGRLKSLASDARWQVKEGFQVEVLGPEDVTHLEPAVSPDVAGGAVHSSHYEVDSYQYTFGLAWAFEKLGGQVRRATVASVATSHGQAIAVALADGTLLPAGAIVLATGPWAGSSEISGAPALPVRPVKGDILRLEFPGASFSRRVTLDGHYLARKPDGMVWAGTTEEEVASFDERPSDVARSSILEGVVRLCPAIESARLARHTACLRPVSVDGLPIVGRASGAGPAGDSGRLFVANGAGKKGILLSPAIARMVARLALDGDEGAVPSPFRSDRFAVGAERERGHGRGSSG